MKLDSCAWMSGQNKQLGKYSVRLEPGLSYRSITRGRPRPPHSTWSRRSSIPTELGENIIVSFHKCKGVALERGNYWGLKLLARVAASFLRQQVHIGNIHFGFMPGRGITDAIFTVRPLQEKFHVANKALYMPVCKRHSIVCPDWSFGGLLARLTLTSGWCVSYRACIGMGMNGGDWVWWLMMMISNYDEDYDDNQHHHHHHHHHHDPFALTCTMWIHNNT